MIEELTDDNYTELLIRYLAISPKIADKAKQLGLTGEDLVINDLYGSQVYKEVVDSLMENCPCSIDLLSKKLNQKFEDKRIPVSQYDNLVALLDYVYTTSALPSDEDYLDKTLNEFLKKKRVAKVIYQHKNNPTLMVQELNATVVDLAVQDVYQNVVSVHPFAKPIYKQKQDLIGTGISKIDERLVGLGLGEYALIIGYSGGGKTVMGTNIVANNAINCIPSTFVSCEENEVQISQRFYSKYFDIPYTELHKGQANLQLEGKFKEAENQQTLLNLQNNLHLLGLKGLTPVTPNQIYNLLVRKYEKTGFIPSVVVVDQLQFIVPDSSDKNLQSWEIEKVVSAELDELSHKSIDGQHFALWVLHQAKGKLKRNFTRDEIDGFKGIIHKADLVVGIGRDGINSNECDIFSLKVRHCPEFSLKLTTDFKYMRFALGAGTGELAMPGYSNNTSTATNGVPSLPDPEASRPPAPPISLAL